MTFRYNLKDCRRLLLVDANNIGRWIGGEVNVEVHIPPIGLLYLATYTAQQHPDLEIKVLETSLDTPTDEQYVAALDAYQPDVVGIRSIAMFKEEFRHIVRLTKDWRDVPVIGGGPIASSKRERLLSYVPEIDATALDEGELTLASLFSEPIADVPGLFYRDGDQVVHTGPAKIVDNLDDLPLPSMEYVDLDRYEKHLSYAYNHRRQGVLITSRGCPFKCTYCNTFAGKAARLMSADRVFEQMDLMWKEHNISDFYVVDDIFNVKRNRVKEVMKKIIASGREWRLYFVNGLRADCLNLELVDLMVEAGAVWITYAIETASPRIQKLVKKHMRLDKSAEIINYTQDKGIVVNINTMYGFPTETAQEAQMTLDFLGQLNKPSLLPYHFCLRGYEGCEIVDQAIEAGWDPSEFLADNNLAYHERPKGSPTFSADEMLDHVLQYHQRFGMLNQSHLRDCIQTLRNVGYTDQDLVDMYEVLMDRPISTVDEIVASPAVRRNAAPRPTPQQQDAAIGIPPGTLSSPG